MSKKAEVNQGNHNPYFSRWFSAMLNMGYSKEDLIEITILILVDGFLQFFLIKKKKRPIKDHNPYFSRWFSAIWGDPYRKPKFLEITILILVDGFLQYGKKELYKEDILSQSLF